MQSLDQLLKLNYNSDEAERVLRETSLGLPKEVGICLIGGAVRNALIRELHGTILRQRDYDQVITKVQNNISIIYGRKNT